MRKRVPALVLAEKLRFDSAPNGYVAMLNAVLDIYLAVAQETGTKMEPWSVATWTETCETPPVQF